MELSCDNPAYRDELSNAVIWDREKYNNASINEIRKDFGENCLSLKWVMMISTPTMTLKQQIGKVLFRQLWRFHTHDEIEREA